MNANFIQPVHVGSGGSSRLKRKRGTEDGTHAAVDDQPSSTKRALFHCNHCSKDISNTVRIKCAVCSDFDLCLECFSVGVELHPHKSHHAYRVVDNLSFPLFDPEWGADEELLLLEAIDMSGVSNWAAVADHVGTKTRDECKAHYVRVYLESPAFPLPTAVPEMQGIDPLALQRERIAHARQEAQVQQRVGTIPASPAGTTALTAAAEREGAADSQIDAVPASGTGAEVKEEAAQGGRRPSKGATPLKVQRPAKKAHHDAQPTELDRAGSQHAESSQAGGAAQPERGQQAGKTPAGPMHHGLPHEAAGALRIHTAEASTAAAAEQPATTADASAPASGRAKAAAALQSKDPEAKAAAELQALTGYHAKRREFDPEWDNEAELLVAELEFKDDEPSEETEEKLQLMEIYNQRLSEREQRREFVIERGLVNIKQQQALDRRRGPAERELVARLRCFAQHIPQEQLEQLSEGLVLEHRLRSRIQELTAARAAGLRMLSEADAHAGEQRRAAAPLEWTSGSFGSQAASAASQHPLLRLGGSLATPTGNVPGTPLAEARSAGPALTAWRTRRGLALDVSTLPGLEQLHAKERELCASARLLPVHYLELKALMLRDGQRRGWIPRAEAKGFFRLDAARATRVYDLLVSMGWLHSTPPTTAARSNNC